MAAGRRLFAEEMHCWIRVMLGLLKLGELCGDDFSHVCVSLQL